MPVAIRSLFRIHSMGTHEMRITTSAYGLLVMTWFSLPYSNRQNIVVDGNFVPC